MTATAPSTPCSGSPDMWTGGQSRFGCVSQAQLFPSNQRLVPYKVEDGKMWGGEPHSETVAEYTRARASEFWLSAVERAAVLKEWRQQAWKHFGVGALVAFG